MLNTLRLIRCPNVTDKSVELIVAHGHNLTTLAFNACKITFAVFFILSEHYQHILLQQQHQEEEQYETNDKRAGKEKNIDHDATTSLIRCSSNLRKLKLKDCNFIKALVTQQQSTLPQPCSSSCSSPSFSTTSTATLER